MLMVGMVYVWASRHRDINPSNILLYSKGWCKLADFGVAHICENGNDVLESSAGTRMFMAPECVSSGSTKYGGMQADVWAMGITLYCFLRGTVPWSSANMVHLHEEIKTEEPILEAAAGGGEAELTPHATAAMKLLLEKDPARRATLGVLREHAWLTRGGLDAMEPAPTGGVGSLPAVPVLAANPTPSRLRARALTAPATSSPLARSRRATKTKTASAATGGGAGGSAAAAAATPTAGLHKEERARAKEKATNIRRETTLNGSGAKTTLVVETKLGGAANNKSIRTRRKRGRSNRA